MTPPTQTRELCQRALDSPLGIEVEFNEIDFEFGLIEARTAATTLQRRIRAFRLKAKGFESLDTTLTRTPTGYSVRIVPHALSIPLAGTVRDIQSGTVLPEFGETAAQVNALSHYAIKHFQDPNSPLTADQEALLFQHSPDAARDLYAAAGWTLPTLKEST